MRQTDFNSPISKPALKAAKATCLVDGEAVYLDVFDRLQNKLFVENQNIEAIAVLEEVGISLNKLLDFKMDNSAGSCSMAM